MSGLVAYYYGPGDGIRQGGHRNVAEHVKGASGAWEVWQGENQRGDGGRGKAGSRGRGRNIH